MAVSAVCLRLVAQWQLRRSHVHDAEFTSDWCSIGLSVCAALCDCSCVLCLYGAAANVTFLHV